MHDEEADNHNARGESTGQAAECEGLRSGLS
ncbi:MAG: hypothetical protein ACI9OJ_004518 [Myxococcota bacterium]|jgi:hypothetical protein